MLRDASGTGEAPAATINKYPTAFAQLETVARGLSFLPSEEESARHAQWKRARAIQTERERHAACTEGSDVIHLLLVRAFVEQLLKGDVVGGVFQGLLQFFPRAPQFGRALRIADGGRIEHL